MIAGLPGFRAGAATTGGVLPRVLRLLLRAIAPAVSILGLWYLAIWLSGLPAFVLPRPERVLQTLVTDWPFIAGHLVETLRAAALGFIMANVVGIGLAVLFVALPFTRLLLMPAAITLRNVPYVALVSVLILAMGDGLGIKVLVVTIAGFFTVLVNTHRGLLAADPIVLDRMHILDASRWNIFVHVRLRFALPYLIAAQEITGSGAIIVTIAAEWMTSSSGLGYVINRAMAQYRGDQVYAVALLAALMAFAVYSLVGVIGRRVGGAGTA